MMFRTVGETVHVSLPARERMLIAGLPALLDGVGDKDDPAYAALNRPAYPADDAASSEFSRLVEDDIAAAREADRAVLVAVGSGAASLTRGEGLSFLRVLNEARIVLAARSGVMNDGAGWEARIPEDPEIAVLAWLGYLESELLQALPASV